MAEYQTEEEQLAALRDLWRRYGWWVLSAAVLVLGGFLGWNYYQNQQTRVGEAASEVYQQYTEALANAAAGPLSESLSERLDSEFAGTVYHVFSLLQRAKVAVAAGSIDVAVGYYEQAAQAAPRPHLRDLAQLRLARAQQQLGRSDAALAALGEVRGEGYRSLVAELKGDIHLAQGEQVLAAQAYRAAHAARPEGQQRPILDMKLADLPANP